jgi:hypothetical protein
MPLPFEASTIAWIVPRIRLELLMINSARFERDEREFHH